MELGYRGIEVGVNLAETTTLPLCEGFQIQLAVKGDTNVVALFLQPGIKIPLA